MQNFEFIVEDLSDKVLLTLIGRIDEHAFLPDLTRSPFEVIEIDFDNVALINSFGIKTWVEWTKKHHNKKLVFSNVHNVVISQINIVDGFLPEDSEVSSFYVPIACESCDYESDMLFKSEEEFEEAMGDQQSPFGHSCPQCGEELDYLVKPDRFFKNIKKAS